MRRLMSSQWYGKLCVGQFIGRMAVAQPNVKQSKVKPSSLAVVEGYYAAMKSGDDDKLGSYLHRNAKYIDPRWPLTGKDQVLAFGKRFSDAVDKLETVAKFSTNGKVMVVHDVTFKEADKPMRTAMLIAVDDGLIKKMELIADTSEHIDVCTKIFSKYD
jgi:ketosteroid isomerase-like protein